MSDKGTITWLPIEDAPKDGTLILVVCKTEWGIEFYPVKWINQAFKDDFGWYVQPRRAHGNFEIYEDIIISFALINLPQEAKEK